MLLTSRKLIQRKLLDIECDMRGTLRNFGLKVGVVSTRMGRLRDQLRGRDDKIDLSASSVRSNVVGTIWLWRDPEDFVREIILTALRQASGRRRKASGPPTP